jgi:hypothetical protein
METITFSGNCKSKSGKFYVYLTVRTTVKNKNPKLPDGLSQYTGMLETTAEWPLEKKEVVEGVSVTPRPVAGGGFEMLIVEDPITKLPVVTDIRKIDLVA